MLIEAGFDIAFECPARTPMLLQLNVHPSRDADLLTPDRIASDPPLAMRAYLDLFGNRVTRVEVPAGLVTFSNRFVIADSGEPDETPPDVRTTPIADLPDDALLFLVSSRYCDSDKLADFAWSRFGKLSGGTRVVQAICDFVHAKIRFNYADARSTRCASDSMHEGIGVCRDFAHLAIALCRCMNIPARYCTGYLGDMIGRATMRNGARPTFQMRRLAASRMPALVVIVLTHGMAPLRMKPKGKRLSIRNR